MTTQGWKVFMHDLRPPVQGGDPVWDGSLPFELPKVKVDRSADECGAGWNFTALPQDAFRIAGLWPNGRPSRLFLVETPPKVSVVVRGDKSRAARLVIVREACQAEVEAAILSLSLAFAPHTEWMAVEQIAWRQALERPARSAEAVEAGLTEALAARDLPWKLRRFDTAWAAWAAWDAWDARAAWAAWAAWDARAARDARDARDALTLGFASRQGWVKHDAMLLTRGIREAYSHGLEIAIPTGPDVLGWSLDE